MEKLLRAALASGAILGPSAGDTTYAVELRKEAGTSYRVFLDQSRMTDLWDRMWRATAGPTEARENLARFGLAYDLARGPKPTDQIDKIRMEISAFRPIGVSSEYVGRITITNISKAKLVAPVSLAAWPWYTDEEMIEPRPSDFTVLTKWFSRPYFDLPVHESLDPGESVSLDVRLRNPNHSPVEFRAMLFAGPGDR
jgi:hypothetical protein